MKARGIYMNGYTLKAPAKAIAYEYPMGWIYTKAQLKKVKKPNFVIEIKMYEFKEDKNAGANAGA